MRLLDRLFDRHAVDVPGAEPEEPAPDYRKLVLMGLAGISLALGLGYLFLLFAVTMPGESYSGKLSPLTTAQSALSARLRDHVHHLSVNIGERSAGQPVKLEETADYIQQQLESYGYIPTNRVFGEENYRNIEVDLYGREKIDEIIVIGAHYDTRWLTPGADDNASGVAGLLEIARRLSGNRYPRTIRLIAFANEEVPSYRREEMGSMASAKRSYARSEQIVGMMALEMIGYYSDAPGSQRYPDLLEPFYPDRGDFIAFIANLGSHDFLLRTISHFRDLQLFPSQGLSAPPWLERDIRRSDHASYWYYDFPAIMVTDTARARNRNYHSMSDRAETLDYDRMARVVDGLTTVIERLARE